MGKQNLLVQVQKKGDIGSPFFSPWLYLMVSKRTKSWKSNFKVDLHFTDACEYGDDGRSVGKNTGDDSGDRLLCRCSLRGTSVKSGLSESSDGFWKILTISSQRLVCSSLFTPLVEGAIFGETPSWWAPEMMHLRTIYPQETHTNQQTSVRLCNRQLDRSSTGWATGSRHQHREKGVIDERPTTRGSCRSGGVIIKHDCHASKTVKKNKTRLRR